MEMGLIFLLELRMHPQEFLTLVHHPHEAAETGILLFQQAVEFAQGRPYPRSMRRGFSSSSFHMAGFDSM